MNMKQLKYVLVLADEGSFSRASDVLNISQPSLSQYVKKIESEIGMPLFDRSGGNVRITDAGRTYIEIGRKILDLEHQMSVRFSDLQENRAGSLTVGTAPYRSAGFMPEVVRTFHEFYPGIQIIIKEYTKDELIERMERGEFDLCLTTAPVDAYLFDADRIMEEELIFAVPGEYPALASVKVPGKKYPAIETEQLNGCRFVVLTENQVMQQAFEKMIRNYGLQVSQDVTVKSLEAQIAMVRAGVGTALVPSGIERFCGKDEVRFYSFIQEMPKREVIAIRRKNQICSEALLKLIEIMKAYENS